MLEEDVWEAVRSTCRLSLGGISESQGKPPGAGRMPRIRTPSIKGQAEEEGAVEQKVSKPTEEPGSHPGRNFKKGPFRKDTVA